MNKCFLMGAVVTLAVGSLFADELNVREPSATTTTTTRSNLPVPPPIVKKKTFEGPLSRKFELRVGPRISFLTGDVKPGKASPMYDIWDDVGFDKPNLGVQFDADWQPYNRFHVMGGLNYDNYDQKGTPSVNLTRIPTDTDMIPAGSEVKANADLLVWELKLGWDVIRGDTYRMQVYGGGKLAYVHGKVSSSRVVNSTTGATLAGGSTEFDEVRGILLAGIDQRVYITRRIYLGGDLGASGFDNFYLLTGEAYAGYDFSTSWGVRAGYAFDYLDLDNGEFAMHPLLGAVYVQAVWGF
jgi:hypothetical protein